MIAKVKFAQKVCAMLCTYQVHSNAIVNLHFKPGTSKGEKVVAGPREVLFHEY